MTFIQLENMHVDVEKIDFIQEEPQHLDVPMIVIYYVSRLFRIRSDSPKWTELQALFPASYVRINGAHIDAEKVSFVREEPQAVGQPICVISYHDRELRTAKGSTEWNELHALMYPEA